MAKINVQDTEITIMSIDEEFDHFKMQAGRNKTQFNTTRTFVDTNINHLCK